AGAGDEHYLVIMFVDMRGSTRLAEGRLPFDTVFVINQFLNAVSRAVAAADTISFLANALTSRWRVGAGNPGRFAATTWWS
ncbi:MAG TPA: hypothetical protein VFE60_12055, partial [Roseiarcus sp.]|nr:hypothetical protein [Roseiarcus sp.]